VATATKQPPRAARGSGDQHRTAVQRWLASLRHGLERPMMSYQLVIGVTALLLGLGLVMVLSASSVLSYEQYGSSYYIFGKQAMWAVTGIPIAWIVSRTSVRVMRWFAYPAMVGSIVLICMTYIPGVGVEVNGNQNWLNFGGPVTIQPSEIAKLAIVIWAADLYARKEKLLDDWKHLLIPMIPATGLVVALVVGQRDVGTALVLFAIVLGMLWVVGAPARLFVGTTLVLVGVATYLASSDAERVKRLTTFIDPLSDLRGDGWQAAHGFFALATGQFWGVGLGASRQKWGSLPEAHTDFIFAVIGEETGLFGTMVVLGLFMVLGYTGFRIASRAREPFARYAAAGITVWLLSQALINIGMVLGLLPVIGIPLPLVSYGGSALLPTLIALGMLSAFARAEPGARVALQSKRVRRQRRRSTANMPNRQQKR